MPFCSGLRTDALRSEKVGARGKSDPTAVMIDAYPTGFGVAIGLVSGPSISRTLW